MEVQQLLRANRMKAQGLPLNTIVLAALALIVLVVLAVMITQRANIFGTGMRNATEQKCSDVGVNKTIGERCNVIYGSFTDLGPNEICCRENS